MKVKILIITPYSRDANSFWRCMGPMSYLAKNSGGDIEIHLPPDNQAFSWDRIADFDLVFMHRPCRPDDLTVIKIARNLNIPVWSDYDDWLFHLPSWNQARSIYHNASLQSNMGHIMACSDVISVTTEPLYTNLKKVNPNVIIVPNAYRSDLFQYRQVKARNPIYMWRGTNTHDGDLDSVKEAWPKLKQKVHFLGSPSWQVLSQMKEGTFESIAMNDNLLYFKYINELAPKVLLFPLQDCFFNRCKSNIAYIEALHAGAICVAPDLPEWKRPGVVTYQAGNAEAFLEAAGEAMNIEPHDQIVEEAFDHMKDLYDIHSVNQIRIEIIRSMLSPSFERNKRDPFDQLIPYWALSKLNGNPMPEVHPDLLKQKHLEG